MDEIKKNGINMFLITLKKTILTILTLFSLYGKEQKCLPIL